MPRHTPLFCVSSARMKDDVLAPSSKRSPDSTSQKGTGGIIKVAKAEKIGSGALQTRRNSGEEVRYRRHSVTGVLELPSNLLNVGNNKGSSSERKSLPSDIVHHLPLTPKKVSVANLTSSPALSLSPSPVSPPLLPLQKQKQRTVVSGAASHQSPVLEVEKLPWIRGEDDRYRRHSVAGVSQAPSNLFDLADDKRLSSERKALPSDTIHHLHLHPKNSVADITPPPSPSLSSSLSPSPGSPPLFPSRKQKQYATNRAHQSSIQSAEVENLPWTEKAKVLEDRMSTHLIKVADMLLQSKDLADAFVSAQSPLSSPRIGHRKHTITTWESEKVAMQKDKSELEKRVSDLSEALDRSSRHAAALQAEMDALKVETARLDTECKTLSTANEVLRVNSSEDEAHLKALQTEKDQHLSQIVDLSAQIRYIESDCLNLRAELAAALEENAASNLAISAMIKSEEKQKGEIESLKCHVEEQSKAFRQTESELESRVLDLRQALDGSLKHAATLQVEVDALREGTVKLIAECKSLSSANELLRVRSTEDEAHLKALQTEKEQQLSQIVDLHTRISCLESDCLHLQAELATAVEENVASKLSMAAMLETIEKQNTEIDSLKYRYEELLTLLEIEQGKSKAELGELRSLLKEAQSQLRSTQEETDKLYLESKNEKAEKVALTQVITEARAKNSELEQELISARGLILTMKEKESKQVCHLSSLKDELAEDGEERDSFQEEIEKLNLELINKEGGKVALMQEIMDRKLQNSELEQELFSARSTILAMREKEPKQVCHVSSLKKEFAEAIEERDLLQKENDKLYLESKKEKAEKVALMQEITETRSKNSELEQELISARREILTMREKESKQVCCLASLKEELAEVGEERDCLKAQLNAYANYPKELREVHEVIESPRCSLISKAREADCAMPKGGVISHFTEEICSVRNRLKEANLISDVAMPTVAISTCIVVVGASLYGIFRYRRFV